MFAFDDLWRLGWLERLLHQAICLAGHDPQRDHCGRPEHDHCAWCGKSMPFAWPRKEDR